MTGIFRNLLILQDIYDSVKIIGSYKQLSVLRSKALTIYSKKEVKKWLKQSDLQI